MQQKVGTNFHSAGRAVPLKVGSKIVFNKCEANLNEKLWQ
jgi:hypothetical protein